MSSQKAQHQSPKKRAPLRELTSTSRRTLLEAHMIPDLANITLEFINFTRRDLLALAQGELHLDSLDDELRQVIGPQTADVEVRLASAEQRVTSALRAVGHISELHHDAGEAAFDAAYAQLKRMRDYLVAEIPRAKEAKKVGTSRADAATRANAIMNTLGAESDHRKAWSLAAAARKSRPPGGSDDDDVKQIDAADADDEEKQTQSAPATGHADKVKKTKILEKDVMVNALHYHGCRTTRASGVAMLQSKIQENGYEREQRVFLLRMTPAEVLTHFAVGSEARALAEKSEALVPGWLDQEMDDHDKRHGRKDEHLKATKPYYWILDGQHRTRAVQNIITGIMNRNDRDGDGSSANELTGLVSANVYQNLTDAEIMLISWNANCKKEHFVETAMYDINMFLHRQFGCVKEFMESSNGEKIDAQKLSSGDFEKLARQWQRSQCTDGTMLMGIEDGSNAKSATSYYHQHWTFYQLSVAFGGALQADGEHEAWMHLRADADRPPPKMYHITAFSGILQMRTGRNIRELQAEGWTEDIFAFLLKRVTFLVNQSNSGQDRRKQAALATGGHFKGKHMPDTWHKHTAMMVMKSCLAAVAQQAAIRVFIEDLAKRLRQVIVKLGKDASLSIWDSDEQRAVGALQMIGVPTTVWNTYWDDMCHLYDEAMAKKGKKDKSPGIVVPISIAAASVQSNIDRLVKRTVKLESTLRDEERAAQIAEERRVREEQEAKENDRKESERKSEAEKKVDEQQEDEQKEVEQKEGIDEGGGNDGSASSFGAADDVSMGTGSDGAAGTEAVAPTTVTAPHTPASSKTKAIRRVNSGLSTESINEAKEKKLLNNVRYLHGDARELMADGAKELRSMLNQPEDAMMPWGPNKLGPRLICIDPPWNQYNGDYTDCISAADLSSVVNNLITFLHPEGTLLVMVTWQQYNDLVADAVVNILVGWERVPLVVTYAPGYSGQTQGNSHSMHARCFPVMVIAKDANKRARNIKFPKGQVPQSVQGLSAHPPSCNIYSQYEPEKKNPLYAPDATDPEWLIFLASKSMKPETRQLFFTKPYIHADALTKAHHLWRKVKPHEGKPRASQAKGLDVAALNTAVANMLTAGIIEHDVLELTALQELESRSIDGDKKSTRPARIRPGEKNTIMLQTLLARFLKGEEVGGVIQYEPGTWVMDVFAGSGSLGLAALTMKDAEPVPTVMVDWDEYVRHKAMERIQKKIREMCSYGASESTRLQLVDISLLRATAQRSATGVAADNGPAQTFAYPGQQIFYEFDAYSPEKTPSSCRCCGKPLSSAEWTTGTDPALEWKRLNSSHSTTFCSKSCAEQIKSEMKSEETKDELVRNHTNLLLASTVAAAIAESQPPDATAMADLVHFGDLLSFKDGTFVAKSPIGEGRIICALGGAIYTFIGTEPDASKKLRKADPQARALDLTGLFSDEKRKELEEEQVSVLLIPSVQSLGMHLRFAKKDEKPNASIVAHPRLTLNPHGPLRHDHLLAPGAIVIVADASIIIDDEVIVANLNLTEGQISARNSSSLTFDRGSHWAPSIVPDDFLLEIHERNQKHLHVRKTLDFEPSPEDAVPVVERVRFPADLRDNAPTVDAYNALVRALPTAFSTSALKAARDHADAMVWHDVKLEKEAIVPSRKTRQKSKEEIPLADYQAWYADLTSKPAVRQPDGQLPLPQPSDYMQPSKKPESDPENQVFIEAVEAMNVKLIKERDPVVSLHFMKELKEKLSGEADRASFSKVYPEVIEKYHKIVHDTSLDPYHYFSVSPGHRTCMSRFTERLDDAALSDPHFATLSAYAHGICGFPLGAFFTGEGITVTNEDGRDEPKPSLQCLTAWRDALQAMLTSPAFFELTQKLESKAGAELREWQIIAHCIGVGVQIDNALSLYQPTGSSTSPDRIALAVKDLPVEKKAREHYTIWVQALQQKGGEIPEIVDIAQYIQFRCEFLGSGAIVHATSQLAPSVGVEMQNINGYWYPEKESLELCRDIDDASCKAVIEEVNTWNRHLHSYRREALTTPHFEAFTLYAADDHPMYPPFEAVQENFRQSLESLNKQVRGILPPLEARPDVHARGTLPDFTFEGKRYRSIQTSGDGACLIHSIAGAYDEERLEYRLPDAKVKYCESLRKIWAAGPQDAQRQRLLKAFVAFMRSAYVTEEAQSAPPSDSASSAADVIDSPFDRNTKELWKGSNAELKTLIQQKNKDLETAHPAHAARHQAFEAWFEEFVVEKAEPMFDRYLVVVVGDSTVAAAQRLNYYLSELEAEMVAIAFGKKLLALDNTVPVRLLGRFNTDLEGDERVLIHTHHAHYECCEVKPHPQPLQCPLIHSGPPSKKKRAVSPSKSTAKKKARKSSKKSAAQTSAHTPADDEDADADAMDVDDGEGQAASEEEEFEEQDDESDAAYREKKNKKHAGTKRNAKSASLETREGRRTRSKT